MIQTMREYPPEMYNEILLDYHYRFPKFNPNPYPKLTTFRPNSSPKNDTN